MKIKFVKKSFLANIFDDTRAATVQANTVSLSKELAVTRANSIILSYINDITLSKVEILANPYSIIQYLDKIYLFTHIISCFSYKSIYLSQNA